MAGDVASCSTWSAPTRTDLAGYSTAAGSIRLLVATEDERLRRLFVGGIGARVLGGAGRRPLDPLAVAAAVAVDDPSAVDHPGSAAFRAFVAQVCLAVLAALGIDALWSSRDRTIGPAVVGAAMVFALVTAHLGPGTPTAAGPGHGLDHVAGRPPRRRGGGPPAAPATTRRTSRRPPRRWCRRSSTATRW